MNKLARDLRRSQVAILVPAYNEEATIFECVRALQAAMGCRVDGTVLVVDNNSKDATATQAERAGATVLSELRQGKGYAVASGVAHALNEGFDWVAFHDADNEYHASDMVELIMECIDKEAALSEEGSPAPCIMGVGLRQVELGSVLWRSVLANWVTRTALRLRLGKTPPYDILTGARVFNAAAARLMFAPELPILRGFELETAMTRRAMEAGLMIVEGQVRYHPRAVHEKKITAFDLLPILGTAISVKTR